MQADPHVPAAVMRDLRVTAAAIEEAARQYRVLVESSRAEVADSAGSGIGWR